MVILFSIFSRTELPVWLAFSCMIPRDLLHLDGGLLPGDPSMVFGTTGLLDPGSLA